MFNKINYYNQDLNYSNEKIIVEKTNAFLTRKLTPILQKQNDLIINIRSVVDKKLQYKGYDKIILTKNNKFFKVEEKIRRKFWNDILIELVADNRYAQVSPNGIYYPSINEWDSTKEKFFKEKKGQGWIFKDYTTDLISYYFEEEDTGFLFSWKKFRKAFFANYKEWFIYAQHKQFGFDFKYAKNKDSKTGEIYEAVNIAVPIKIFKQAYIFYNGKII